jgi:hypothetical protein
LQHVLYRAAKADPRRRFHALRDKVYREDVLWRAWIAVRRNNGAPGIDKTTLADVEEYGVSRLLGELATEVRAGTWRPLPARQVLIPKPGSAERRPLAIAAVFGGHRPNAGGEERRRAVCGRTACTVRRTGAGNGASATAPALDPTPSIERT